MSEHWIWSNKQGAWLGIDRANVPYVTLLQQAGRFCEGIAAKMIRFGNEGLSTQEWPDLVMIPVTNSYLFPEGQRLVEDYVVTGDRGPMDEAFFRARDQALMETPEFQESLGQFFRGEGREIEPAEFASS